MGLARVMEKIITLAIFMCMVPRLSMYYPSGPDAGGAMIPIRRASVPEPQGRLNDGLGGNREGQHSNNLRLRPPLSIFI